MNFSLLKEKELLSLLSFPFSSCACCVIEASLEYLTVTERFYCSNCSNSHNIYKYRRVQNSNLHSRQQERKRESGERKREENKELHFDYTNGKIVSLETLGFVRSQSYPFSLLSLCVCVSLSLSLALFPFSLLCTLEQHMHIA